MAIPASNNQMFTDESLDEQDYEITGAFKESLYEKYDELLDRVNAILNKKKSKISIKSK